MIPFRTGARHDRRFRLCTRHRGGHPDDASLRRLGRFGTQPNPRHDLGMDHVHAILKAAEAACRSSGLKLNALQLQVLGWIAAEPCVRAYDLLGRLSGNGRRPSPPTIYRALDGLREHGFIHRIDAINGYVARDPGESQPPVFVICPRCKRLGRLDSQSEISAFDEMLRQSGFGAIRHVEIQATCKQCS